MPNNLNQSPNCNRHFCNNEHSCPIWWPWHIREHYVLTKGIFFGLFYFLPLIHGHGPWGDANLSPIWSFVALIGIFNVFIESSNFMSTKHTSLEFWQWLAIRISWINQFICFLSIILSIVSHLYVDFRPMDIILDQLFEIFPWERSLSMGFYSSLFSWSWLNFFNLCKRNSFKRIESQIPSWFHKVRPKEAILISYPD